MNTPRHLLTALFCAAMITPAFAEDKPAAKPETRERKVTAPSLTVGSPAPELKVAKWISGEPVTAFEKDKTYLIECWATWCGPCVKSIPHVNELHRNFKDKGLVVIGMNVWDSPESKVTSFVKKQGEAMSYRVAFDGDKNGEVYKNWLLPAGIRGIPSAFLVREGKIIWIGHPARLNDQVISDILAGKPAPAPVAAVKKKAEKTDK